MNFKTICSEYLNYSIHFKSPGTSRYDISHLNSIIQFLESIKILDSDDLSFDSLYKFIDYSRQRKNTNNTINKRISLLNRAIAFQVSQNKCNPIIIASFPKLKEIDKRFDLINESTMKRIINHMRSLEDSILNTRNRLIVFLFIDTGIRLSEMSNIKLSNIDFNSKMILLTETKTKREREVYYSTPTSIELNNYIQMIDNSNDYLLRNTITNNPLNYIGIIRVFHKIRDDLKLKKLSSHMIRHSYGTLAYKFNVTSLFTKNTMGHARIDMTERYTHYDIETNRKIYDKFSPMEYYSDNKK